MRPGFVIEVDEDHCQSDKLDKENSPGPSHFYAQGKLVYVFGCKQGLNHSPRTTETVSGKVEADILRPGYIHEACGRGAAVVLVDVN